MRTLSPTPEIANLNGVAAWGKYEPGFHPAACSRTAHVMMCSNRYAAMPFKTPVIPKIPQAAPPAEMKAVRKCITDSAFFATANGDAKRIASMVAFLAKGAVRAAILLEE